MNESNDFANALDELRSQAAYEEAGRAVSGDTQSYSEPAQQQQAQRPTPAVNVNDPQFRQAVQQAVTYNQQVTRSQQDVDSTLNYFGIKDPNAFLSRSGRVFKAPDVQQAAIKEYMDHPENFSPEGKQRMTQHLNSIASSRTMEHAPTSTSVGRRLLEAQEEVTKTEVPFFK